MKKISILIALISITLANNYKLKDLNYISNIYYMKHYQDLNSTQKLFVENKVRKNYKIIKLAKKDGLEESKEFKEKLQEAKDNILGKLYVNKISDSIKIKDNEAKEYYKNNPLEFTKVHAYTIVRKNKEDITKYIKILKNQNKQNVLIKFKELAKKYSMHPKSHIGGDLGFINYNYMAQPFGKVAFNLKEKEFTKTPIKTPLGYVLIYIEKRVVIPFENVKNAIKSKLKKEKFNAWYESL